MKKVCMLGLVLVCLGRLSLAQDKVFDWVRASDEVSQLDPAEYHAGRVYRPGPDGGGMHVDIHARRPVTIAMAFASDWNAWTQHPESQTDLELRCVREHVTSTTYECHMPPNRPMVLLIRDERTADHAVLTGIGVVLGRGVRQFIAPNDVTVSYYSWTCVQNCIQPEFQWFSLVREKYELTSVPKIYSLLTPERDGQQVNVRIKAPIPMTVALLPSELADQVYDNPGSAFLRAFEDLMQAARRAVAQLRLHGEPGRWTPVAGGSSRRRQDPAQEGRNRVADGEVLS